MILIGNMLNTLQGGCKIPSCTLPLWLGKDRLLQRKPMTSTSGGSKPMTKPMDPQEITSRMKQKKSQKQNTSKCYRNFPICLYLQITLDIGCPVQAIPFRQGLPMSRVSFTRPLLGSNLLNSFKQGSQKGAIKQRKA